MGVKEELQCSCYEVEGGTAEPFLWARRKNCRAVVMRVKEEQQSRCYGSEGRTTEQLL